MINKLTFGNDWRKSGKKKAPLEGFTVAFIEWIEEVNQRIKALEAKTDEKEGVKHG